MHRHASPLATCVRSVACAVSIARMLSGEGASSTVYNVTRGYYVSMVTYVLPIVHAEQGSAPQARAGSISMRDVRKVKIHGPRRNDTAHLQYSEPDPVRCGTLQVYRYCVALWTRGAAQDGDLERSGSARRSSEGTAQRVQRYKSGKV